MGTVKKKLGRPKKWGDGGKKRSGMWIHFSDEERWQIRAVALKFRMQSGVVLRDIIVRNLHVYNPKSI
jgi:hypothetical protein